MATPTIPLQQWPTGSTTYGDGGTAFQLWHGTLAEMTAPERAAMSEKRLLIAWSKHIPGWYNTLAPNHTGSRAINPANFVRGEPYFIGLLTVVRERSWGVIPPSPYWNGPVKQIRKRQIISWRRYRHSVLACDREIEAFPMAWVAQLPPTSMFEWFKLEGPGPHPNTKFYLNANGTLDAWPHAVIRLGGQAYLAPWMGLNNQAVVPFARPFVSIEATINGLGYTNPFTGRGSTIMVRDTDISGRTMSVEELNRLRP